MREMAMYRRRSVVLGLIAATLPSKLRAQEVVLPDRPTGVWRGTVTVGPYRIDGEMIFQPNGTFRRANWWNGLMTWASGPYTIARNWIHFEIDAYGPEIYQNQPQAPPPAETWMVERYDGRVIEASLADGSAIHFERQE